MDNDTRRMEGLGWPSKSDDSTSRLDGQAGDPRLRCLRCSGQMAETRAWAKRTSGMARTAGMELAPRQSKPAWLGGDMPTVTCFAMTCTVCGWTEFYAEDMLKLRSLLQGEG